MGKSQELYQKAKTLIPGGTQLLSKRPEMFLPNQWPSYYSKAKGCEVWDMDNNKYIDMSYMGIGTCTIGYADDEIDELVTTALREGNMCTLNAPEEVELAELLCELHPWADMARFCRTGGEAGAIAIRIARAYSKKDIVLFGGYHGWSDWYLASNLEDESNLDKVHLAGLEPNGVPMALKGTAYPFYYNDTESFKKLIEQHKGNIGAVIIESVRNKDPEKEFSDTLRELTSKYDIPLIIDEVSAGFRMTPGGAHLIHGIKPDIAIFAKGMSNGYPMAAIIGKKHIMEAAQTSFISSTYWTDRIGPVAALATIRKIIDNNICSHLISKGQKVKALWQEKADKHNIKINLGGMDPVPHFGFVHSSPLVIKTLFTQLMLERGFLASTAFYASFAHKDEHIEKYRIAVDESFGIIANAIKQNNAESLLNGPTCHSGFQRLT
ncbi:MAG: aminotransferase class III-fold pyridoxal phosphate-dependent enzyme [bacterium]|nr:aminotransferase class III-fold pyridoxal phosphate-dependent enzyme [bacterium]